MDTSSKVAGINRVQQGWVGEYNGVGTGGVWAGNGDTAGPGCVLSQQQG